jgi:hypothetical protein
MPVSPAFHSPTGTQQARPGKRIIRRYRHSQPRPATCVLLYEI